MKWPDQLTRVRAPAPGPRSPGRDWDAATDTVLSPGWKVQPATMADAGDTDLERAQSTWNVLSRPGVDADLLPTDRIRWEARTFRIVGEVRRFKSPSSGIHHHIEFLMEAIP